MKILFLVAHPLIQGPLPKINSILITLLRNFGCDIETSIWSAHSENETLGTKVAQRLKDIQIIKKKIGSFQPELLLVTTTHDWKAILRDLPLLITVRKSCPLIVLHLHGSFSNRLVEPGNHLMKFLTKNILKRADAVFLYSNEEIREWSRFYPKMKYFLVDNPYKLQNIGTNEDKRAQIPVILFAGRLVEEKGIFDLLEAVRLLKDLYHFRVSIIGDGKERERLKAVMEYNGMKDQIKLLGYLSGRDLKDAYESASIFVLPSWREGFPLVLMEAMDYGLPIVTTGIRGAADRLVENENCLFIQPKNPKELAKALEHLLSDSNLCEKMRRNNQQKIKEFSPTSVGKKYFEILEEIVNYH